MSDEKSNISEKEASQPEEKDRDTAGSPPKTPAVSSPAPKSASGSKAGSSKGSAKPGSAKSIKSIVSGTTSVRSKSPKSSKSPKGSASLRSTSPKAPAKSKKKKVKNVNKEEPEEEQGLPEGVIPLFMSSKSQDIFSCRADEDVTVESPLKFIKKQDILDDFYNRAAVSDFHPVKQIILDYPGEEICIAYDADYKYGENFILATTEEAKVQLMKSEEEDGEEEEEEEEVVYRYVPPVPKEWISQGSEREIEEEGVFDSRKRVWISAKRLRREFGAPVEFSDRNVADAKDGYIECISYEDKSFELKRIELDVGTQAIPEFQSAACQTEWKYPRNNCTQYSPREFTEEEREEINKSDEMSEFIQSVAQRFELAMQQNDIMDVFFDDWVCLADEDNSFGSKADNHLKEYQSFTDLQFSKDKRVTSLEWHPTIRGVVAVSVSERMSFDERIDQAAKVIMAPSLILIWSFTDPIHPQLLLEAPDDIFCFKFCPTDPNIIVGGCMNGQVVLWDISAQADKLKTQRGGKQKKDLSSLPGFEEDSSMETPLVRYCAVSSIEHSHRAPITDIQWMPDHMELTRMGVPQENKSGQCVQIITCATDHPSTHYEWLHRMFAIKEVVVAKPKVEEEEANARPAPASQPAGKRKDHPEEQLVDMQPGVLMVWDVRPPKATQQQHDKKKEEVNNPIGVPTTFKHLDLTWKPHLKVNLSKSEPGGDHSPTKFTIHEKQGDRSAVKDEDGGDKLGQSTGMQFGSNKPGSAKRTLTNVNTHMYVGTEDGELVYVDWMPQKDTDSGKIQTPKPDFYHAIHDGPIVTLQRSPFFRDILLCVGGWSFSLWKEGVNSGPILSTCASSKKLTSAHWSTSRPAVFYIGKQDGSVDVWDLLDRTHEPSMTQSVAPTAITSVCPFHITNKQHLLAVGDAAGTLHILEIPWSLRQPTPNELTGISNYFEREVKRRSFVVARWNFREKEKMEIEAEAKKRAGIAPNVTLTEEEVEHRMKQEYQAYLEEEAAFLRALGLKEDPEEALPQMD